MDIRDFNQSKAVVDNAFIEDIGFRGKEMGSSPLFTRGAVKISSHTNSPPAAGAREIPSLPMDSLSIKHDDACAFCWDQVVGIEHRWWDDNPAEGKICSNPSSSIYFASGAYVDEQESNLY